MRALHTNYKKLALVLGVLGIAILSYLFVSERNQSLLFCPAGSIIDCSKVLASAYSSFFGVPVSAIGILWFVAILALVFAGNKKYAQLLLPLWVAGLAFIAYLIYAELFSIHAICLYCSITDVIILLMGIPVLAISKRQ